MSDAVRRNAALMLVLASAVVASIAFLPTVTSFAFIWSDATDRPTYKHGFLIVAATLWLLYRRREELARLPVRPAPWALPLLAATSLLWFVVNRAGVQVGAQVLFPVAIWLGILCAAGWRVARLAFVPIAFLYFAVPIWDATLPILRGLTTQVNGLLVALVGIPAWIDGNEVHIAAGTFEIADGCSGIHYLIVALALGALHAELNDLTGIRRVATLALAGGLALFTNWIRVFAIIVAGHLTNMQHFLVKVDHYYFGWVLFALTLVVFFWVTGRAWFTNDSPPARVDAGVNGGITSPAGWALALAGVAVIALGPALGWAASRGHAVTLAAASDAIGTWSNAGEYRGPWQPRFDEADGAFHVRYVERATDQQVAAYVAMYETQRQGHELVGASNTVFGERGWRPTSDVSAGEMGVAGQQIGYLETEVIDDALNRQVLRWTYLMGDRTFVSTLRLQLWYGVESIWSNPPALIFAVAAPCGADCSEARAALSRFTEASFKTLTTTVAATR